MKNILRTKWSLLVLPLSLLMVVSCGKDDDKNDDNTPVLEQAPPTPTTTVPSSSFTRHCRKADEVEGGNFQFDWSDPLPGQVSRIDFNTVKNLARLQIQGVKDRPIGQYTAVPAPANTQGSFGELTFREISLSFPVIPTGTIRGSNIEYAIGNLTASGADAGTYLCSTSLLKELDAAPISDNSP
jgi:hypothetical protein